MSKLSTAFIAQIIGMSFLVSTEAAAAERLSGSSETVARLHVYAEKGVECDLILPWESLILKLQVRQDRRNWDTARRQLVAEEIDKRLQTTLCDDAAMNGWLTRSRPGFEAEMLAPYLVIYHSLAQLDKPPTPFDTATARLDYRDPIRRIEAKFAELEASGRNPEGSQSWPEYRAGLKTFIDEAVAALESGEALTSNKSKQALTLMSSAGIVVETWLLDTK